MNLYLQQDSDVLASITGAARLPCDSIVLRMGRPDIVLGCVLVDNPMHENWMVDPDLPGDRLFCYSGTLADGEDPFIGDMRNWTPGGLEALQELIERIQPALETQDRSICLRPHAQGILSDVPGCRKFMETAPPRVELCVDPIGMLTAEMLPDADEHVARIIEGTSDIASMFMLRDCRLSDTDDLVHACPLGDGLLSRDVVMSTFNARIDPGLPVVITPERIEQQVQWLGDR